MRNRRDRRGLKPPPKSPSKPFNGHITRPNRRPAPGRRKWLLQAHHRRARRAQPPAYGRHGTRAREWQCWGLAQAAYKWLKAVGLGAGACCVHCVVLAPSATPLPNPPPKHSRPPSQCTWTPSLLVARAFRANFDTDSTAGPTTRATRAGESGGVTTAHPMSQLLS